MVLKNSVIKKSIVQLALLLSLFLFPLQAESQNKDSVQGDFEALMALYNSTQGNGIEVLASERDLPSVSNATYPYMYIINDEIWALSKERYRSSGYGWDNYGAIWKDKTGWPIPNKESMGDATGVEVDENGRVIKLDMQKQHLVLWEGTSNRYITRGNGLAGTLPPEIGNLKKMQWFNIKQEFLSWRNS